MNENEKLNDNVKENIEEYEEKKSIDYYIELFLNYNYYFNYNLLLNEKDMFYEKYKYPVDKLRENIVKGQVFQFPLKQLSVIYLNIYNLQEDYTNKRERWLRHLALTGFSQ